MNAQLDRIEKKLDELLALAPTIRALGKVLLRVKDAAPSAGVTHAAFNNNKSITKYEQVGHKRVFVEIGSVDVLKKRKGPQKPLRHHG